MASAPTLLLDGGTGTELRMRGVEVPSHITSIWSAKALIEAPDEVVTLHRDYIEAGADVVTTNNYAVTRPLLERDGLGSRVEELTVLACDLAHRARDTARGARRDVRIAGSLPPLDTSYRADLVGDSVAILAEYRRMAAVLAPRVDVLLCETLASAREALAAATAARETDREVWLSWTLQGNRPGHLPSGESLEQAYAEVAHLDLDAHLVNCCGANLATSAVPALASLTDGRVGAYAHPAEVRIGAPGSAPTPLEKLEYEPLDVDGYTSTVAGWLDAGASIIGGCCFSRPEHIAALRNLLDARNGS